MQKLSFFFSWKERRGLGVTVWTSGSQYEGNYVKDECDGKGVFFSPEGFRYEGTWKKNEKYGKGFCSFPNGAKYLGFWKHDQRHGKGSMIWPDGRYYWGEWKNDKREGKGFFQTSFGLKIRGYWKGNELKSIESICLKEGSEELITKNLVEFSNLENICKFLLTLLTCDDFLYSDLLKEFSIPRLNFGFLRNAFYTILHHFDFPLPKYFSLINPFT